MTKPYYMFRHSARRAVWCVAAAAVVVCVSCAGGEDRQEKPGHRFTVETLNGYTPVKHQGTNPVCWAYAMLSAIETEHIMRGDSVHLSVKYAVRQVIEESAVRCYLAGSVRPLRLRATAHTLLDAISARGLVPNDAYGDADGADFATLGRKAFRIAAGAASGRQGLRFVRERVCRIADEDLGPVPRRVFMLGAEYTPQEFARSVCAPGEYIAVTSFTHHPYHKFAGLELPDNYNRDRFYNLPLDTMMSVLAQAVSHGRGVCWEGDISEPGFSFADGTAVLPYRAPSDAAARQSAFERFDTTDDHSMAVVGMARDSSGRRYFIMKNSWGTDNPFGGLMYLSEDYVRMKTIALFLPADCVPVLDGR